MAEILVVKSVPLSEVLTLLSYYMPGILVETIPMGIFLGVMITYGSLSATSEIVAMRACGMGLNRILRVPFALGVVVTIFIFFFQENVAPLAYKKSELLTRKIAYTRPAAAIEPKRFAELGEEYHVYINEYDETTKKPKDLVVFVKKEENINPTIMLAETLDLTATEIRMNNIKMYELDEVGRKSLTGDVKQRIAPFSTFFGDFNTDRDAVDSYGIVGLKKEISRRKAEGSPYVSYEIKFYRKLYVPISTIILCVLGVVLSTNHARTGKGISFGVSIFIIAIYMIAMNLIITFAEKNTVPIWFSMSIPNLILAGVTLYLYLRKVKNS
jgi:lipopolysaccharide export system permease protein